jgi:succinate dehydrogenase / fumarate reductase, flavoprotein subunit
VCDRTGIDLIRSLQDHGVHQGNDFHMECSGLGLLKDGDRIAGCCAYWRDTGRFVLFKTKAVIMATGGGGKCWRVTSNSWEYTGDGLAMAYEAGAILMDMEYTQFHPTGMVWPPSVRGTLVTEGVRGDGGILKNSKGERFMFNYIPERFAPETADTEKEGNDWLAGKEGARRPPELLTRDVVARAITAEIKAGRGSPHGGAFLDIASRRDPDFIRRKLPSMYHQFKELAEVDITQQAMEVGPTLHYFMGGIKVDPDTQMTNVPGLFACGECSAGLHGANRLGGNSLSDLLVFGTLSGLGAAQYVRSLTNTPQPDKEQILQTFRSATSVLNRESGENPYLLHEALQDIMGDKVGIVRHEEELKSALDDLEQLKPRVANVKAHGASQYNPGWHEALSMRSMMITAEAVTLCALARKESRGAHTRLDYEGEREEWLPYKNEIRMGADGRMIIEKVERPTPPNRLKEIAYSKIEDLEAGLVGADAE